MSDKTTPLAEKDDLDIPEFLRRPQQQESNVSHKKRTTEYTPTAEESEKIMQDMAQNLSDPTSEIDRSPTPEEIMSAIRKLTAEIDDRTKVRTGLKVRLKKIVGDL